MLRTPLVVLLSLLPWIAAGVEQDEELAKALEVIRDNRRVPALAAAAIRDGHILAAGAVGMRRYGGEIPVTLNDQWHLASCTKSMTASVAAMLVERGRIEWHTTVGEIFPDLRNSMDPGWAHVTLEQLLAHRGGAAGDAPGKLWAAAKQRNGTPTEQRMAFVAGLLEDGPDPEPGTKFVYSNQGYSIVGVMLERVSGKSWEELMQDMLFEPLGMKTAGFGAPGTSLVPGSEDQPWGHKRLLFSLKPLPPGPDADNPPAIGPGGTVHCSIVDFARYAGWHARAGHGDRLLGPQSFTKLHTPLPDQDYALGWSVTERGWGGGTVYTHTGSNTFNFAVMWVAPARRFAVVATTNVWGDRAEQACDEAVAGLIERFLGEDK